MIKKRIMTDILDDIDKFNELDFKIKAKFKNEINNIKIEKLYDSPIHGLYHSEKVALFALILGNKLNCTERELNILVDAAIYHDFKREDDREDPLHGYSSAVHLEEVIEKGKYTDDEIAMIKAMMEYHCVNSEEKNFKMALLNHEVPEHCYDECFKLANILKDADMLDRKRFSKDSIAALKPRYLHFNESHDLIKFSEKINNMYIGLMFTDEEILSNKYLRKINSRCFHSVGVNVFKIPSIIDSGILSFSEMRKQLHGCVRNFDGGNSDKWISVVPANHANDMSGATKEFLHTGIVFCIDSIDIYIQDKSVVPSYAKSYGLPYKKNDGYTDEMYAFKCIDKDKIGMILVCDDIKDKDLSELDRYIFNSYTYDLFEKNLMFYLEKMNLLKFASVFSDDLKKYKDYCSNIEDHWELNCELGYEYQNSVSSMMEYIRQSINEKLSKFVHSYYANILGIPENQKITICDAINYELSQLDIEYEVVNAEETIFVINKHVKKTDENSKVRLRIQE